MEFIAPMICFKCRQLLQPDDKVSHGLHEACFRKWFGLTEANDFTDLYQARTSDEPSTITDEKFRHINSSFFHGKYKKYSARLADRNYILKVEQAEYPELPPTEYLSNQLAALLGLEVANFFYILFQGSVRTFVTQNILDQHQGGTLNHIYLFLGDPPVLSCSNIMAAILQETGALSEAIRFIELTLFDSLIGNHDRHGRNLAILTLSGNKKRLAPFYDNPSYLGIEMDSLLGAQHEPRGAIITTLAEHPTLPDYVTEFENSGYKEFVQRFYKKVIAQSNKIFALIRDSFISDRRKGAFIRLVERRIQELENAVH